MSPVETNTQARKFLFGNYEITETTGSGGMGVVYRAIDLQLGRTVALKILRDDLRAQEHIVARFQREAEAIAALNHPNIVHVYSVGSIGKVPYLAMEFIEGTTLGNLLCERGPIPWQEALGFAAQIADALATAHDCGIIHRDIKPGNILLDHSGKAYVTDFGIAKVLGATTKLTVDGSRLGTPQYMSPERCKNKEIVPASDIYSLGVLIYQAISGRLPYEANSPVELVAKITGEDPVRISEYVPDIPQNVERLLAHMLDPNPKARPQSARTLQALIERVLAGLPLEDKPDAALQAIDRYRAQFERETSRRTPAPLPKTAPPAAPWGVRVARAWFQLSRMARVVLATLALALAALLAGIALWQVALRVYPASNLRLPATDTAAWTASVLPVKVTQESQGVAVARLGLEGYRAAQLQPLAGGNAVLALAGLPGGPVDGQYALVRIQLAPTAAEIVLEPSPLGTDTTQLLAAAPGDFGVNRYVLSHRGRLGAIGPATGLAANVAAAQPLPGGGWLTARLHAGTWVLESIDPAAGVTLSLPVPAGPVTALAVSPSADHAAFVTGPLGKQVLWSVSLSEGAAATQAARGHGIALAPQAFGPAGPAFVAAVQAQPGVPAAIMRIGEDGLAATLAAGTIAIHAPTADQVVFTAPDRAGNLQLWLHDGAPGDPRQLTYLAAGLDPALALLGPETVAAPLHDQPAVALVTLP